MGHLCLCKYPSLFLHLQHFLVWFFGDLLFAQDGLDHSPPILLSGHYWDDRNMLPHPALG
jgi:hypothetical protein